MRRSTTSRIKGFKPGERLTAEWTQQVARALKDSYVPDGLQPGAVYGTIAQNINPFSVLAIDTNGTSSMPREEVLTLPLKKVESSDTHFVTNGSIKILSGIATSIAPIIPNEPLLLTASVTNVPAFGEPCGVLDLETTLSSTGAGFVALSNPFSVGSVSLVWAKLVAGVGSSTEGFYLTAEDDATGWRDYVWAQKCDRLGYITDSAYVKLWNWGNTTKILTNVKANYVAKSSVVNGQLTFSQGVCIDGSCNVASSISANILPTGTVGTSYSASFATSSLDGPVTVTGALPPGITRSGTNFSGTPTTAGKYYIVVTGVRTVGTSPCTITRVFEFIINAA